MTTPRGTRLARLGTRDLRLLAELAAAGVLVLAFLGIGRAVTGDLTRSFDEAVLLALRTTPSDPIGSGAVTAIVVNLSALGSNAVAVLIVAIAVVFFAIAGHWRHALLMVACALGSLVGMSLLKAMYQRPRPTIVTQIEVPGGYSFPSGHSMMSAALYLTLAVLLASTLERRRLRVYVVAAGAFVTLLIGVTRMYLGVHYPTDVLAGWTAGALWALVCGLIAFRLGARGAREGSGSADE